MQNPQNDNPVEHEKLEPGVANIPEDTPDHIKRLVAAALDGTVKLVAIVRDKDGKPKFDDPENVPKEIMDALSTDDKAHLATLVAEKVAERLRVRGKRPVESQAVSPPRTLKER